MTRRKTRPVEERFWEKVDKSAGPDSCWPWRAPLKPNGYGSFGLYRGRNVYAHRAAYFFTNGLDVAPKCYPARDALVVCHSCDNPGCCNPAHLWLGTQKQNSEDCHRKRRNVPPPARVGARHHKARLTDDDVLAIRASNEPRKVLADRYGVTLSTLEKALYRATWRHLP